jgi:glycosyltransferase involved in cell wall biosynthesis
MMATQRRTLVAVCTYRRPQGLSVLLAALRDQTSHFEGVGVVVIDNDPHGSAAPIFEEFAGSEFALEYVHASPQGLVSARNAGLDLAATRRAGLIFIDDDEVPEPNWLAAFLRTAASHPGSIVAGPVTPRLASAPPPWCPSGSFWTRPTYRDNVQLFTTVPDGNIYFPVEMTTGPLRYDWKYNTAGAQDTHLLRRWLRDGGEIYWSAGATVVETIPEGRLSLRYALERRYFESLGFAWIEREAPFGWIKPLVRGIVRSVQGGITIAAGTLTREPVRKARGYLLVSAGRGMLNGLFIDEYDRYADFQFDTHPAPR